MSEVWMIVCGLPLILITAFFFGIEPPFYHGICLLGLAFWALADSKILKILGIFICAVGTILFCISLIYYFTFVGPFPENPFEFRIPFVILNFLRAKI